MLKSRARTRVYVTLAPLLLGGCAGPATPLGAVWETRISQVTDSLTENRAEASLASDDERPNGPSIRFNPPRQVLHGASAMEVVIDDPVGINKDYVLRVKYNGHDVTRSFLKQARISTFDQRHRIVVRVPVVRLSPDKEHRIEMSYASSRGIASSNRTVARYEAPVCRVFELGSVLKTEDFEPDATLLHSIDVIARQTGFNPAFATALIAQESSFNPRTVSWAGAIGLTQVTPAAEDELDAQNLVTHWPRYPGITNLPSPLIKFLIMGGEINERNEWRLKPERSIRGGLAYLHVLAEKWASPENVARIQAVTNMSDVEVVQAKLILASYNSGFTRVQTALIRDGKKWMQAPELEEARRYVNRIFSYCDSFSQPEVEDYENET